MSSTVSIGNRLVGNDQRPYLIAAINSCADGDLSEAYKIVDAAIEAGADAIKVQNFTAESLAMPRTPEELAAQPWHNHPWQQHGGETYHTLYSKLLKSPLSFASKVIEYAESKGIAALCTPFGVKDAQELRAAHPRLAGYCVSALEAGYTDMLEVLFKDNTTVPVLVNAAFLDKQGLDALTQQAAKHGTPLVLLAGNKAYQAPENRHKVGESFGLGRIHKTLSGYKNHVIGVSDHFFPTIINGKSFDGSEFSTIAVDNGASVIKKCFKGNSTVQSLEANFASTTEEFKQLRANIDKAWAPNRTPSALFDIQDTLYTLLGVDKTWTSSKLGATPLEIESQENLARHYWTIAQNVPAEATLKAEDLTALRYSGGDTKHNPHTKTMMAARKLSDVVGRRIKLAHKRGELLLSTDLSL